MFFRRKPSSSTFPKNVLLSASSSVLFSARRSYITTEVYRDTSLLQEDFLNLLGFASSENPTRQQLAVAFKRELSRLVEVTRSPVEQAKIDEERGATPVIEFDSDLELLSYKLENSSDALRQKFDADNDANTFKSNRKEQKEHRHEALRYAAEQRMGKLLDAYRSLNNSRYKYLYDSSFDSAVDVQLGYRRSDTHFANFDSRRQEFFFDGGNPQQQGRPLSEFSGAYKRSVDLDSTDIEQAIADRYLGEENGTQTESIQGGSIQFVLSLDFVSAFTGCSKEISFQRRGTCKLCGGCGARRKKNSRCGQCGGRGQLRLPSGSSVVAKQCALCLGTGSVLPPDCSSCKGTGLGSIIDERCTVHVSPGAADGDKIYLRGKGNAGTRGGQPGTCVVTVLVKPHRFFNRDGSDLHVIVPVPLSVVLGGGSISVPVLDDEGRASFASVPIFSGQQQNGDGEKFRYMSTEFDSFVEGGDEEAVKSSVRPMVSERVILLPHYGMWRRSKDSPFSERAEAMLSRGGLYVHCVGVTPKLESLTKAQRAVLVEHFFSAEEDASSPREEGKTGEIAEGDFASAKDFCRHWLP